jgi:hypothetical protein
VQSYYPLPWTLGDFTHIAYHGEKRPESFANYDFVVVETKDADEVRGQLGPHFEERRFNFRSGMEECTAFFSPRILGQNWDLAP